MDDNFSPSVTTQLVDALIDLNRDVDPLLFPNRNHDFSGTWGTWHEDPYFTRRRWDYFVEHPMRERLPQGKPASNMEAATVTWGICRSCEDCGTDWWIVRSLWFRGWLVAS